MLLHLIRHGETDWNVIRRVQGQMESRLTERGRQQARDLAGLLQTCPIDHIYCSSSRRARETAAILFEAVQDQIRFRDELREIHLGPWEGKMYAELETSFPVAYNQFWNQPHRFAVDGAETFAQLQQRGLGAIDSIFRESDGRETAIVSHGALLKAILCHFEGRELARLWEPPGLHNCAHSIIELESGTRGRILRYAGEDI